MQKLSLEEVHIDELLQHVIDARHVELYLEADCPVRTRGGREATLRDLNQYENVDTNVAWRLVSDVLSDEQVAQVGKENVLRFRYTLADSSAQFEVCVARRNKSVETVWHLVPKPNDGPLTIRFFG